MPTYKGYNDKGELIIERVGVTLTEAFPLKYWEVLHFYEKEHRAILSYKGTSLSYKYLEVKWKEDPQTIAPPPVKGQTPFPSPDNDPMIEYPHPPPQTITDANDLTEKEMEKLIMGGQVNEIVKDMMNVPNEDKPPMPREKESQPNKFNTMNISIDRVDGTSNAPEFIVLTINGHPYIYKLSSQG